MDNDTRTTQKHVDLVRAFARLFDTADGQLVLDHLKETCGAEMPLFGYPALADIDKDRLLYHEGMRAVYWHIQETVRKGIQISSRRVAGVLGMEGANGSD